jgi:uncharacterized protein (DUF1501 family)
MANTRRDFLKKSVGLAGLGAVAPHLWVRSVLAKGRGQVADKILVVVQLDGGNDGLNTVVPFAQGAYYDARPSLAIPESAVLELDNAVGLEPSLVSLMPFYQAQKLAVVQGVGYPMPNRSHFRSKEIWQTADPVDVDTTGWLGRYADKHLLDAGDLAAINIGSTLPKTLAATQYITPSIVNLASYQFGTDPSYVGDRNNQITAFNDINTRPAARDDESALAMTATDAYSGSQELQGAAGSYSPLATYPSSQLGRDLQFAAQIIVAGVGTRVIYTATGGYDTHANEDTEHPVLLARLADALAAFQTDIEAHNLGDKVAVLVFSEFGRRVNENGSTGTDHGTCGPVFLLGSGVAGGLYGETPSCAPTALDSNGDLIYTVDFRTIYSDVLQNWLGVNSQEILEDSFTPLGAFRS